jgi:[acyl-carrier-protein] S-malonyltransferase
MKMNSPVAYIFPGQGSQVVGMGRDLAENYPAARDVYAEADEALGAPLSQLCFEGPAEALQLTENTQPAILATSIAALRALESEGLGGDSNTPAYVAGHSLGEYSALVAAGALSLGEAVRIVRARGRYMQEAVPPGAGAMAAVLGLSVEVVSEVCAEVEAEGGGVCSPANINSPGQIVIAGHAEAVERAIELLKERGAKRALKLNVSAPFHCALMRPAQERLAIDLSSQAMANLKTPLISNVDVEVLTEGERAKDALVRQVSSPVRWQESMETLVRDRGVNQFIEIGPGKVLCGLLRQIAPDAKCLSVGDAPGLQKIQAEVAAGWSR